MLNNMGLIFLLNCLVLFCYLNKFIVVYWIGGRRYRSFAVQIKIIKSSKNKSRMEDNDEAL